MIKAAFMTKLAGYGFQVSLAIIAGLFLVIGAQQWKLHTARADIAEVRQQVAVERANVALVAQEAEREARRTEREHEAAMAALRTRLIEESRNVETDGDDLLDRVAAGGLRERFTCPPAGSGGVSGSSGSTAGGDGSGQAGFTPEDAEVAIRIAADGDDAIRKLGICQEVINVYRGRYQEKD